MDYFSNFPPIAMIDPLERPPRNLGWQSIGPRWSRSVWRFRHTSSCERAGWCDGRAAWIWKVDL